MRYALLIFFTLQVSANILIAQDIKTIKLKHQASAYAPKSYHIASIIDDRTDTTNIGMMRMNAFSKKTKVNLQNGAAWAFMDFIDNNIKQDKKTTPITLHITDLKISEKQAGIKEQADISMGIIFYSGDKKLVAYNGSGYIEAGLDAGSYMDKLIREKLEGMLKEFEQYWNENSGLYTGKAAVEVNVEFTKEPDDPDHIIYSKQVPLSINDFQGPPDDMSMAAAATVSGIGMGYSSEVLRGKISLKVTILAYFDKSRSWCKTAYKNDHTLAHEQLHFDITALKACELANSIKSYSFTSDNYGKELEQLRKQNLKDAEQMEADYDKETVHGTITAQQQKWIEKIKKQIAEQTCFQ